MTELTRRRFLSLGGLAAGAAAIGLPDEVGAVEASVNPQSPSGVVYAWGQGLPPVPTPMLTVGGAQIQATAIGAGSDVAFAILANGQLMAWGLNTDGQLGQGNTNPYNGAVVVPGLTHIKSCEGGFRDGFASNGSVYGWGDRLSNTPETVPVGSPLSGIRQVAAAWRTQYALTATGATLYGWGENFVGELGQGSFGEGSTNAITIPLPGPVAQVTAGHWCAAALLKPRRGQSAVYGWGYNVQGQLGVGDTVNRASPVQIPISNVTDISLGGSDPGNGSSIACKSDGTCWVWGDGKNGQMGNGTFPTVVTTPQQVPNLTNIVAVSTHSEHMMALDSSGRLWAWGSDEQGIVGTGGETDNIATPTNVLSNVVAIVAGATQSVALVA